MATVTGPQESAVGADRQFQSSSPLYYYSGMGRWVRIAGLCAEIRGGRGSELKDEGRSDSRSRKVSGECGQFRQASSARQISIVLQWSKRCV